MYWHYLAGHHDVNLPRVVLAIGIANPPETASPGHVIEGIVDVLIGIVLLQEVDGLVTPWISRFSTLPAQYFMMPASAICMKMQCH